MTVKKNDNALGHGIGERFGRGEGGAGDDDGSDAGLGAGHGGRKVIDDGIRNFGFGCGNGRLFAVEARGIKAAKEIGESRIGVARAFGQVRLFIGEGGKRRKTEEHV